MAAVFTLAVAYNLRERRTLRASLRLGTNCRGERALRGSIVNGGALRNAHRDSNLSPGAASNSAEIDDPTGAWKPMSLNSVRFGNMDFCEAI